MKAIKAILLSCLGWLFIFLGILGLFLPFLQGILFLLIGLYILSHNSLWAKRILLKIRWRFPRLADKMDKAKGIAKRYIR